MKDYTVTVRVNYRDACGRPQWDIIENLSWFGTPSNNDKWVRVGENIYPADRIVKITETYVKVEENGKEDNKETKDTES